MRRIAPAAALAVALWAHLAAALGAHPPNFFDGALFLLQPIYAAHGLAPYRDFAFLYPPGSAILFGELLGLATPSAIRAAMWTLAFGLALLQAAWLARLSLAPRRPLAITLSLLLSGAIALLWGEMGVEALTPHLSALLLLAVLRDRPAVIAILAGLATLFRWDRPLASALALAAAAALLALNPPTRIRALRLARAAAACALGTALGAAAILARAARHGAIAEAVDAILVIPFATMPYRALPIPWTADPLAYDAQFLAIPLALAILAATPQPRAALLALPLALLPYATGRADAPHALPMSLLALAAATVALVTWRGRGPRIAAALAALLLVLPLAPQLARLAAAIGPWPDANLADRTAAGWTAGCTPLFPAGAQSLFVGQREYTRYLANIPLFHLVRPDLRPAARFLSDEPGLQNTCRWGEQAARALLAAPRPLLALLDTAPQPPEPNATATMASCGRIEAALAAMPHQTLGRCPFGGRELEIRLYK